MNPSGVGMRFQKEFIWRGQGYDCKWDFISNTKDKEKEFKDLWIVKAFQAYDGLINSRSKSQRPSDKE